MHNYRRTYFYSISFISLEATLWGLIGLIRTISELGSNCTFSNLSFPLAIIVVSTPTFFLHWHWANKSESEDDGHSTLQRAIFLYATLFATLIPVAHNLLAFINRVIIKEAVAAGINFDCLVQAFDRLFGIAVSCLDVPGLESGQDG